MIKSKDEEINALKNVIYNTQIQQLDDNDVEGEDTIHEVDSDESSEAQPEINVKEVFCCNFCDFTTEHKGGLKIHNGKSQKNICTFCGKTFSDVNGLKRH